jgi:hypothetical protein
MSKSLAVLALMLPAANAAYHWTKGNKICGGLIVPCVDAFSCSATAIGPCESDADPTAYLESAFVGMGYVDSTKFLDAATGKTTTDATTYKVVTPTGPGFRDFKAEFKMDGDKQKFGYSMAGNVIGDTNTAGGYVGMVSYLNTGTDAIDFNTVKVFGAGTGNEQKDRKTDPTSYSDSDKGAPGGPFEVCISDIAADKSCGAKRTLKPDEYKFSIFGNVQGPTYDATVKAGANGFPVGMDKLGVRMVMKATGFEVKELQVNGKSWTPSMVNEDVTSMFIMHASGGLSLKFPKKYNTGSLAGYSTDAPLTNTATHDMQIRVHSVDSKDQTILIDYLFDTSKLPAGTWFIYDPDVTEAAKGSANPNVVDAPSPSNNLQSASTTYAVAAAAVSGVVAVVAMLF